MTNETTSFIKFELIRNIGNEEGKNSDVFLAADIQLGSDLIIKRVKKKDFKKEEYFLEAQMIYGHKHPNIVEIQYASQDEEFIYMAMPYYPNGSLNALAKKRFLTVREIIKYALDLVSAVNFIHSKGLIHLDIKPTNILLDSTGRALLTDFGLSRYINENGEANQVKAYVKHSDPQWIMRDINRTIQTDIYQIGVCLYRLCNGIDVLDKQYSIFGDSFISNAIVQGKFPNRNDYLPHIPSKLRKIVNKAMEVDLSKRYTNTTDMLNDICEISEMLDWVYTGKKENPYIKQDFKYEYSICVNDNNDIKCYKRRLADSKTTIIKDYCFSNVNKPTIVKQISYIIREIN